MKYKMLVSDLDGTIGKDDHTISTENIQAANNLVQNGVKLVLCSGRSPVTLAEKMKQMGVTSDYIIGFNGCTIKEVSTGKNIYEKTLDPNLSKDLINQVSHFDVTIAAQVSEGELFGNRPQMLIGGIDDEGSLKVEVHPDLTSTIKKGVHKILMLAPREILEEIYEYMKDKVQGICGLVFTNKTILEFIPLNANKGEALKFLSNELNLPLENIASCGDNFNDIELIQVAGMGIAMYNAVEPLKAVADKITEKTNNDHGFAEIIDFILNENKGV